MTVLGFKRVTFLGGGDGAAPGEACLVLPFDPGEEEVSTASEEIGVTGGQGESPSALALGEAWAWLEKQLAACLEMEPAKRPGATSCAECALQLRLPSGQVAKAGFFASEPLRAVRDFLDKTQPLVRTAPDSPGFAAPAAAEGAAPATWVLQQAHPKVAFGEERLGNSLSALGLVPRATLVATPSAGSAPQTDLEARQRSEAEAEAALRRAHESHKSSVRAKEVCLSIRCLG